MNYKLFVAFYLIFAASIVYWDINRHGDNEPMSNCHNEEIRMVNDRPMCTTCKLYCEVSDGKK